uniref:NADH-ubiquinone oxidoreductase chain 2 n=1 Tax=Magnusiomyces tetraspermus TaxID=1232584 RepID=A0A023UNH4_9ASCO|nr:NADH dehydrogenase subunit 2 [Magnusiomyces tetraspermus]AHY04928.1 NADH dehydrogenase subunit 2 [Magnusiomyces tetraspermus]
MTVTGTTITILSTFNLQTMKEVKEVYRIGVVTTTQVTVVTYDSVQTDFVGGGTATYNDVTVVTSYTKMVEATIFTMGIAYTYVTQEYVHNIQTNSNNAVTKGNSGSTFVSTRKPVETIVTVTTNITGVMTFMQWNNFIVIFITTETQSYTTYTITTFFNKSYKSTKSGTTYFTIGSVGSIVVTTGFVTIYAETGTTNTSDFFAMYNGFSVTPATFDGNAITTAYVTITTGTFTKIGTAPFHNWTINIYANTPTVVTTWISIVGKVSITTVVYTTVSNSAFTYNAAYTSTVASDVAVYNIPTTTAGIAATSIVFGATGGTGQFTIKRIIGYSGTVNSGYFTFIITSNNNSTTSTFTFNIYQYGTTHVVWFTTITVNGTYFSNAKTFGKTYHNANPRHSQNTPVEFVKDTYGFTFANPYTGFCYIVVTSSTIGIPPTTGFYAKFYVLFTGIQSSYTFTAFTVTTSSAVTAYYYIFIVKNTIVADSNSYSGVTGAWRSHAQGTTTSVTPTTSIVISVIIMVITATGVVGTDIANNGTHIVESYYINKHV